jgi:nitrogen fixation-related uncharacterized protein
MVNKKAGVLLWVILVIALIVVAGVLFWAIKSGSGDSQSDLYSDDKSGSDGFNSDSSGVSGVGGDVGGEDTGNSGSYITDGDYVDKANETDADDEVNNTDLNNMDIADMSDNETDNETLDTGDGISTPPVIPD